MGQTISEWHEIEEVFINYFQDLFQITPSQVQIDACLNSIKQCVTHGMNEQLQLPFTWDEVEEALSCLQG